jgi:hypothetical protein
MHRFIKGAEIVIPGLLTLGVLDILYSAGVI